MIGSVYTGVICYADDIFLLSTTAYGMQQMINMAYEYGKEWKITFNPNPGKSDIVCFNAPRNEFVPRFYLGNDEIKMTTRLTHLGFLWDSKCKTLLLSHAQSKVDNFVTQCNHFINRGLQKAHPKTIATVIKVQLFPLLYGMELGSFTDTQLATWKSTINASIKSIYRCSKHCSNKLLECVGISNLIEYLDFRRSILEYLIFNNPYTQSILSHRMENGMNNLCTSLDAMFGNTRNPIPYKQGENGITDSLQTLIEDWNDFQSQKQFRDILHYKLPHREV
jgi:hypothetical protein